MRGQSLAAAALLLAACGCARQQPVTMAPPIATGPAVSAPPAGAPGQAGVYNWQDVPQGQQVPVTRAVFDQGGYQIYAASGETILVPFANQNLYVMQFGRSNSGQTYFVNEGTVPVLYVRNGDFLENAAAQGARWYPIPPDYPYSRPMYVSMAPTWGDYLAMGWYPGMYAYGGMWSYHPWATSFLWMPGFAINIGGARYHDYVSYRSYYSSHPGYVRTRVVYNYSAPRSSGSFGSSSRFSTGSFRSSGSRPTGSFGSSPLRSSGSFGAGRSSSSSGGGSGSFGAGRSSGSFGGSNASAPRSSFGGGKSSSFSSSGSGRSSSGSFGGSRGFGGSFSGSRSRR